MIKLKNKPHAKLTQASLRYLVMPSSKSGFLTALNNEDSEGLIRDCLWLFRDGISLAKRERDRRGGGK